MYFGASKNRSNGRGKNFGMMKLLSWGAETDRDSESPAPTDERIAKVLVRHGGQLFRSSQHEDGSRFGIPTGSFLDA